MSIPILDSIPGNDWILHGIDAGPPSTVVPLLVVLNYAIVALLALAEKAKGSRRLLADLARDWYYHAIWCFLIPFGYALALPGAYHTFRDAMAGLGQIVARPVEPMLVHSTAAVQRVYDSVVVTVVTGLGAVALTALWTRFFRATTRREYWWYVGRRFTIPGKFFLVMCALVTWSFMLFLVNTACYDFHFLMVVSCVKELSITPTPGDLLDGLRPVRDLLVSVLAVWSLAAVGATLLWFARRRAGVSSRPDWLAMANMCGLALILFGLVILPLLRFHEVLARQKDLLHEAGRHAEAGLYPALPATTHDLSVGLPGVMAMGFTLVMWLKGIRVVPSDRMTEPLPPRTDRLSPDVFISHSRKDSVVAEQIVRWLEHREIGCWIAQRDIRPGHEWAAAITGAIDKCRLVILILSSEANSSDNVKSEMALASLSRVPVLPFRIETVNPSGGLAYYVAPIHWVDAQTPPSDQQLEVLTEKVRQWVPGPKPRCPAT